MTMILRHVALVAALAMGSAALGQSPPPADTTSKTDLDKIGDTVENIGAKPLKDLNLIQPKIDPAIERIMAAPYSLQGMKTCSQYRTAVKRLTEVLGPDVDAAENQHKAKSPAEQALSLGESAAGSLIPFSGVIRRLSGAEAKQNYAKAAIFAGSLRRAYIKGTARAKGCRV